MKRSNARDISSFFTKKINRENEPQGQASEPPAPESSRIFTPPGPPQISAQSSSPSVNVPEAELDVLTLAHDPGKRKKMSEFHPNERDLVRRTYIQRGPCQPKDYGFPKTYFGEKERRFNVKWFDTWQTWLEYSVDKDAAFCFICYLFRA
ncbi:hypothetical protein POM88_018041 [Heracleum sosnowskyi]|uniref:TTF-type domain-containing protein n=1 Tax=Heracleum sosnowskyi TaxID=360622 RepID=A0AAD8IRT4_9APIA|nr:hypothetical protein POM88_018041 [Heracleum sosnowskyi]